MTKIQTNTALKKFQDLLENLFQFDCADLDFGIYRILNYKRDLIRNFIDVRIPEIVIESFKQHQKENLSDLQKDFEKAKAQLEQVAKSLGKTPFSSSGSVSPDFINTPVSNEYLSALEKIKELQDSFTIQDQVYNDLYNFFSRYYNEGDFIPKYRYTIRNHKYAIPYNGEEVSMYWANKDQYYIKTGLLFKDYAFWSELAHKDFKIVFRVVEASEEINNNKSGKQKYFILAEENPIDLDEKNKLLTIRFNYRELTKEEASKFKNGDGNEDSEDDSENGGVSKKTIKQELVSDLIEEAILKKIKNANLLSNLKASQNSGKSFLRFQLDRYTAKNTKDYFIHKNLKTFLSEQLEYYIKSEVISLDTLSKSRSFEKHITRAKTVNEIGEFIIGFLAQLEDFQKKLWEKKKFVLKTEYVISLDKVVAALGEDEVKVVLKNKEQVNEWQVLEYGVFKNPEDCIKQKIGSDIVWKTLPIDTRYFEKDWTEKLLEKIAETEELDKAINGTLIKSENWQGLNLLQNKYRGKIKGAYVDPPYNTGDDDFIYRDNFQHSSWISMLYDRISLAKKLLSETGAFFSQIDYKELDNLKKIGSSVFNQSNFVQLISAKTASPAGFKTVNPGPIDVTEYILFFTKSKSVFPFKRGHTKVGYDSNYNLFITNPDDDPKNWKLISIIEQLYLVYDIKDNNGAKEKWGDFWKMIRDFLIGELALKNANRVVSKRDPHKPTEKVKELLLKSNESDNIIELKREKDESMLFYKGGLLSFYSNKIKNIDGEDVPTELLTDFWSDISWAGIADEGKVKLKNGKKPERLLQRIIDISSEKENYFIDFFLGSGTSTGAAHKMGRKWIGIEMGQYFENKCLIRMKNVLSGEQTGISKSEKFEGGGFFKYQYIEQYEDALDNLIVIDNSAPISLFTPDKYLMKYFLDIETKDNPNFLNITELTEPFSYKLLANKDEVGEPQEITVDLVETFNYLIGLEVSKFKTRKNNESKYCFVQGNKDGKTVSVVWREVKESWTEKDLRTDRDFIIQELKAWDPEIVYINALSKCILTNDFGDFKVSIKPIEPDFKALLFS